MKTRTARLLLCFFSVCLLLLVSAMPDAPAAPPDDTARMGSDLVIQEIVIRSEGTEEFHSVRIGVRVRNQGGANAAPTTTALIFTRDVAEAPLVLTRPTRALAGGAFQEVEFVIEGIGGHFAGMLVAVADAPVAGHHIGQVREGATIQMTRVITPPVDINNTFGVIFTTQGRTLPLRFQNPLVR
ncbi:MAG: hypothetical protein ACOX9R_20020 [Armatimonadota bacterium]